MLSQMKKFLAIVAITSIMASCTDSSTSEDATTDSTAAPMQSAPMDTTSGMSTDTTSMGGDTTSTVRPDSPATR
jgi:hypothetical protein